MRSLYLLTLAFAVAVAEPLAASTGTEGASFLDIPVGARPAALGSAYSALAADAYSAVWNPGGLGFLRHTEIAGQHLSYIESVDYEFLAYAQPLGPSDALAGSIQYLGSGQIPGMDNSGNSIGDFSSHFAAYDAAYGRRITDWAAIGATAELIDARIGDFTGRAYAANLGAMLRPAKAWTVGATITHIGSKLTFLNTGDSLPMAGHLSAAYRPNANWLLAAEAIQSAQKVTSARGGIEWRPIPLLALRSGYKSDTTKELSTLAGFSAGIGLNVWKSEFSYAWLPLGDLGNGHYFSFVLRWGGDSDQIGNLALVGRRRSQIATRTYPYDNDSDWEEIIRLITASDPRQVPSLADGNAGSTK